MSNNEQNRIVHEKSSNPPDVQTVGAEGPARSTGGLNFPTDSVDFCGYDQHGNRAYELSSTCTSLPAVPSNTSSGKTSGNSAGSSASISIGAIKKSPSFLKRQRRHKQTKPPKLCFGYLDGKLTAHSLNSCAQYTNCVVKMRITRMQRCSERYPNMRKHLQRLLPLAEHYEKIAGTSTPDGGTCQRNIADEIYSTVYPDYAPPQDLPMLEELMSGCQIDQIMHDADDLARMVGSFNLRDEAAALGAGASGSGIRQDQKENNASQDIDADEDL